MLQQFIKPSTATRLQGTLCAAPAMSATRVRPAVSPVATFAQRGGEPSTSASNQLPQSSPTSRLLSGGSGQVSASGVPRRLLSSASSNRPVAASYLENDSDTKGPNCTTDGTPRFRVAVDVDEGVQLSHIPMIISSQCNRELFETTCNIMFHPWLLRSAGPIRLHAQRILQGEAQHEI